MLHLRRLLFLAVLIPALTACGVSFNDGAYGTELFYSLDLAGERTVNSELTLDVVVTQSYPAPVRIACYYENGDKLTDDEVKRPFEERAKPIGAAVLLPESTAKPGDDAEKQRLTFRFSIPEAGDYFLACLTPASPENGLGLLFTIKASGPPGVSSSR